MISQTKTNRLEDSITEEVPQIGAPLLVIDSLGQQVNCGVVTFVERRLFNRGQPGFRVRAFKMRVRTDRFPDGFLVYVRGDYEDAIRGRVPYP